MLMQQSYSCTINRSTVLSSDRSLLKLVVMPRVLVVADKMLTVRLTVAQEGYLQSIEL
jgi:hypothetical protein